MKLDAIDLRILDAVQRDGRITKLKLAALVGLSPTPCWLRLRKLEQAGVISGYRGRLAPRQIGPVTAFIVEVTLANHRQSDFDRFEKAVAGCGEVISCWSVGGGVDYFLKIVTRDIDAYQALIDRLLAAEIGIDRYFTYVVTRAVKEDAPLLMALFDHR